MGKSAILVGSSVASNKNESHDMGKKAWTFRDMEIKDDLYLWNSFRSVGHAEKNRSELLLMKQVISEINIRNFLKKFRTGFEYSRLCSWEMRYL
jgi:hypothetical protein